MSESQTSSTLDNQEVLDLQSLRFYGLPGYLKPADQSLIVLLYDRHQLILGILNNIYGEYEDIDLPEWQAPNNLESLVLSNIAKQNELLRDYLARLYTHVGGRPDESIQPLIVDVLKRANRDFKPEKAGWHVAAIRMSKPEPINIS